MRANADTTNERDGTLTGVGAFAFIVSAIVLLRQLMDGVSDGLAVDASIGLAAVLAALGSAAILLGRSPVERRSSGAIAFPVSY